MLELQRACDARLRAETLVQDAVASIGISSMNTGRIGLFSATGETVQSQNGYAYPFAGFPLPEPSAWVLLGPALAALAAARARRSAWRSRD